MEPLVDDSDCRFLADPDEIYYPTHKKRHHEAVIVALAGVEHWVEGIDRLGQHTLVYRP
jgi:hypothetical protein